ncbi:MAG: tetratricopeptide repeat protein [Phycisphaerales bacterium]|nr:tetratricopeptide repeat protein [Phycisphaerales bacterium]
MISYFAIVSLVFGSLLSVDENHQQLRSKLETIAGVIHESRTYPTVRESAKEYIIGRHLAASDQHGFALAHFRQSSELDDLSTAPWVGMAISLSALGRTDASIAAWKEVLKRDTNHGDALLVLGLDAARLGRSEIAQQYLSKRWLQQDDKPLEALLRDAALSSVLKRSGEKEIVALLKEAKQQIINEALADLILMGDSDYWISIIQQLVDIDAVDYSLKLAITGAPHVKQRALGTILTALPILEVASGGDGSYTQKCYEQIWETQTIPLAPRWMEPVSLAEALSIAAQSMSVLGEVDAPIKLYKKSLELNPNDALTLNNLAWLRLNKEGPTEQVVDLCLRAIELDPVAPYIMDTVGWMYAMKGDQKLAITYLSNALRSSNRPSPETYDHLGDAYWMNSQKESAIRAWKTAVSILNEAETKRAELEGFSSLSHSVWGISVATPERLYDLDSGVLIRRLIKKLSAVKEGKDPLPDTAVSTNGD